MFIVLNPAFARGEDLQLAARAVHELVVGALGPLQRDLRVALAMGDQEGHAHAVEHAVEVHALGDAQELVHVFGAPDPAHMLPVVRYREVAFLGQTLLLHVAPVVIGAPDHAAGEPRLERHGARAEVAAERHPFEADAPRVDFIVLLQPVDHRARPALAVVARRQPVQAQRFTGSRLVEDERRDAALRQPMRQPDAQLHLFGRVQAIDLHQHGRTLACAHAFGAHIERGEMPALIGDRHALAVLAGQRHAARENVQGAPVQLQPARSAVWLQSLGRDQIDRGAAVLVARRNQTPARLVLACQVAQPVGHGLPGLAKGAGAGGIRSLGRLL
jgi:hypothetical protein